MIANYSEIGGVGKLEAGFQQVSFVQIFWNFHEIVMNHQIAKDKIKTKIIYIYS